MKLTYHTEGDYLLPNVVPPEDPKISIWGLRRKNSDLVIGVTVGDQSGNLIFPVARYPNSFLCGTWIAQMTPHAVSE